MGVSAGTGRDREAGMIVDRALQRLLHGWFLVSRGMTLGVRGAILDAEERVFLIRHTYTAGWHMPGGGVELGEDAGEALRREVREEACIEIAAPPALHGVFFNRRATRRDHVLVYVVRDFTVLGPKLADREIAEAAFFRLDSLPGKTTPGTRARLDEIAGRVPRTPFW